MESAHTRFIGRNGRLKYWGLWSAYGDIARARGMTQLAKDTRLSRESLYRSLSGERAPSSDTLFKVLKAMGLQLSVHPAKAA